jgi:tetratricopeptide (TPR) repeat protein
MRSVMARALCLLVTFIVEIGHLQAQSPATLVATTYSLEGLVEVRKSGVADWATLSSKSTLFAGDIVRTGADGLAAFSFVDGTLVRLGRFSAITFKEISPSGAPIVSQSSGKAYYFSRGSQNEPEIHTPLVNAAIYGTELVVDVSKDETTIDVLHGAIRAQNPLGEVSASQGQRIRSRPALPLEKSMLASSASSVQWMIRFPFVITTHDLLTAPREDCSIKCQEAISAVVARMQSGTTLLRALDSAPSTFLSSPRGLVLKALGTWQAGDSLAALNILGTVPPGASPGTHALVALLYGFHAFLTGNLPQVEHHLAAAKSINHSLFNTFLLESYLAQANGDPERALAIAHTASIQFPQVSEALAREAELLLSLEQPHDADMLLDKSLALFSSSPTVITLKGFAAIQRKDFQQATKYFDKALSFNNSTSLPYLGQALVKVRDRNYGEAKAFLSKAVHLDPSVASYRSYLGKLFFEDEDTSNALQEFEAAIALDPHDPSPHLYRSFAHVADNNPVAALKDVERSIELNDARAVYRSRLLLDRDLAVRGAGLSRVFSELGFSDVARIEAIRSITDDYSNFSAHRMLADSYNSIFDAEANLSEKRIADLLSPLSFNLFNSLGEFSTLDDYNALFDKKETRNAVRVDYNSNRDQIGGEILATGRGDTTGYLLSYQPYYMSGSRHRAFFGENLLRGAFQYEPAENQRLIFDGSFRMRDSEGPTEDDYSENVHIGLARVGYNYRASSALRFLVQGEFGRDRDRTSELLDRPIGFELPGESEIFTTDSFTRESPKQVTERSGVATQMIYSSRYLDSVTGLEGKYADTNRREYSPVLELPEFPGSAVSGALTTSSTGSLTSGQAYEYLSLKIPRTANLTLGLTATSVEQDLTEVAPFMKGENLETAITPKLGVVFTPTSWLTTRTAYFESLSSKSVLEDLTTLEPTLVGGISQRYNDLSGAYSRNVGVGVDVKEPNFAYAGAQYLHRNIRESIGFVEDLATYDGETVSSLTPYSEGFFDSYSVSDTVRGYLSLVTTPHSSVTGEALSHLYRTTDPDIGSSIRTDRFRLGYRYFLGKHLSFNTQATYRNQVTSEFNDPAGFWLFDAGVSYRFAEQRGRIFARVDNLLDRSFTYDQSVGLEAPILEGRSVVVGVAYNFW